MQIFLMLGGLFCNTVYACERDKITAYENKSTNKNKFSYIKQTCSTLAKEARGLLCNLTKKDTTPKASEIKKKKSIIISSNEDALTDLKLKGQVSAVSENTISLNVATTTRSATLSWSAIIGVLSYDIDVDGQPIPSVTGLSYVNKGLVPGSTHTYKVKPSGSTDTGWSNSVTVTTPKYTVLHNITSDATLVPEASPYLIPSGLIINEGTTLTIKPGGILAENYFNSIDRTSNNNNDEITVKGTLIAQGLSNNPIIFTGTEDVENTVNAPTHNSNSGIVVGSTGSFIADNVQIKYCAIGITSAGKLSFTNSQISSPKPYNKYTVDISNTDYRNHQTCDVLIKNNTIDGNIQLSLSSLKAYGGISDNKTPTGGTCVINLQDTLACNITLTKGIYKLETWTHNLVDIPKDKTMTVEPGAVFLTDYNTSISGGYTADFGKTSVHGTLNLQGTSANPIVFSTTEDKDYGGKGLTPTWDTSWKGLLVSDTGTLNASNIVVKYAYRGITSNGKISLSDSRITDSVNKGIVVEKNSDVSSLALSSIDIKNCTVDNGIKFNVSSLQNYAGIKNVKTTTNQDTMIYISGKVTKDLTLDRNTYEVNTTEDGILEVAKGAELTIPENTVFKGESMSSDGYMDSPIRVYGKLTLKGTKESPIIFTQESESATTHWNGISVHDTGELCADNIDYRHGRLNVSGKCTITNSKFSCMTADYVGFNGTSPQTLKYNSFDSTCTAECTYSNIDATLNYWGDSSGPSFRDPKTNQYTGNGCKMTGTPTYKPYFSTGDLQNLNLGLFESMGVIGYFFLGLGDACGETITGVKDTVTGLYSLSLHYVDSVKSPEDVLKSLWFIDKVCMLGTPENLKFLQAMGFIVQKQIIDGAVKFSTGDNNTRARMLGKLVGEIIITIALTKGITKALEIIGTVAKSDALASIITIADKDSKVTKESILALDTSSAVGLDVELFISKLNSSPTIEEALKVVEGTADSSLSVLDFNSLLESVIKSKFKGDSVCTAKLKRVITMQAGFTNFATKGTEIDLGMIDAFVDQDIKIVKLDKDITLYRRGRPNEEKEKYGLGKWFGDKYRTIDDTRNDLAVCTSWGNPLSQSYTVTISKGTEVLTGIAEKQEDIVDGVFTCRSGGAVQYWINDTSKLNIVENVEKN